jgi:N-acetylglucosamine-6-phosphate deacetylase
MAAAGSSLSGFTLNGRRILRRDGSLRLEDGTLAGADLALPEAVAAVVGLGTPVEIALAMASSRPAACLRRGGELGHLVPGRRADFVHLRADLSLQGVWRAGQRVL